MVGARIGLVGQVRVESTGGVSSAPSVRLVGQAVPAERRCHGTPETVYWSWKGIW